jgi:hypothetical protein
MRAAQNGLGDDDGGKSDSGDGGKKSFCDGLGPGDPTCLSRVLRPLSAPQGEMQCGCCTATDRRVNERGSKRKKNKKRSKRRKGGGGVRVRVRVGA